MVIPISATTFNLNKRLLWTSKVVSKIPTTDFHHGKEAIIATGKELLVKKTQELSFPLIFITLILMRMYMRTGAL